MLLGECFSYEEDVVAEAHVEHSVCLVEDEERDAAEVDVAEAEMADESARCSDDDIRSALHGSLLLLVSDAVVAAIDGYAADVIQIICKALHGTINLLCKFACRRHDDAVDGIFRIAAVGEHAQYRQKVGCRLACSRLCDAHHVASLQNRRNGMLLNGSRFGEVHVVECIEDIVVEV